MLFTVAKILKQPKCILTNDKIKKMWDYIYIYIYICYSAIKKEGNPAIWYIKDETRGHYVKSDRWRQTLYDLIYTQNLKSQIPGNRE